MTYATTTAPLSSLKHSKRNVRTTPSTAEEDAQLKASIATMGLLQPLLAFKRAKGFDVVGGGRRLRLLKELVREKQIKASDKFPLVILPADASAEEISAAENIKADMDPVDIAIAMNTVATEGSISEDGMMRRWALTPRELARCQRLAQIHPEILKAYRAGSINHDTLHAYASTADQSRQLAVFKSFRKQRQDLPWKVREILAEQVITGDNALAKYVGRDAYLDAGGQIEEDLFSKSRKDGAESRYMDPELVETLALAKLEKAAASLKTREGWGEVRIVEPAVQHYISIPKGFKERSPAKGKKRFTKKEAAVGMAMIYIDAWSGKVQTQRNLFAIGTKKPCAKTKGEAAAGPDMTVEGMSGALRADLGVLRLQAIAATVPAEQLESFHQFQTVCEVLGEDDASPSWSDAKLTIRSDDDQAVARAWEAEAFDLTLAKREIRRLEVKCIESARLLLQNGYRGDGWLAWRDQLDDTQRRQLYTLALRYRMRVGLYAPGDEHSAFETAFAAQARDLHKIYRPGAEYFSRLTSAGLRQLLHEFYSGERDDEFKKAKKAALVAACEQFITTDTDPQNPLRDTWLPDGFRGADIK